MLWRLAAIGFLILLVLSGCAETRLQTVDDSILQQQLSLLEDGKTTKQDILLKFGIPSSQFEGERIFTYRIEFDDKNVVSRHEVRGSVFSSRTPPAETFKSPQPSSSPPTPGAPTNAP
jgi:hypothetical protein